MKKTFDFSTMSSKDLFDKALVLGRLLGYFIDRETLTVNMKGSIVLKGKVERYDGPADFKKDKCRDIFEAHKLPEIRALYREAARRGMTTAIHQVWGRRPDVIKYAASSKAPCVLERVGNVRQADPVRDMGKAPEEASNVVRLRFA